MTMTATNLGAILAPRSANQQTAQTNGPQWWQNTILCAILFHIFEITFKNMLPITHKWHELRWPDFIICILI